MNIALLIVTGVLIYVTIAMLVGRFAARTARHYPSFPPSYMQAHRIARERETVEQTGAGKIVARS